jgi:hypothetical protein
LRRPIALCSALFLAAACTAPRSVLLSPEALPKGGLEAGIQLDGNIPTQTAAALYGGIEDGIGDLYDRASGNGAAAIKADSLNGMLKALIAYSVDPLASQPGAFVRYGFFPRLDGGYHRNGSANALDVRWQFLGPVARDTAAPAKDAKAWRGSIGLQVSSQSFELPSVLGLDKLQSLLRYDFKRKDILVPLMIGKPWDARGRYGGFTVGTAYNLTFLEYDSDLRKLVEQLDDGSTRPFAALHGKRTISAYGGFVNARLGYRWIFLVGSMACYWQDYGTFTLAGGKRENLKGLTFLPTLGLEARW